MKDEEYKRERRRLNALDRLNDHEPRCVVCGEDDWRTLEYHHIAGRAFDAATAILCRNCHRKVSDDQKDHPERISRPPSPAERVAHFLLGLADLFALLVVTMRDLARALITSVADPSNIGGQRR